MARGSLLREVLFWQFLFTNHTIKQRLSWKLKSMKSEIIISIISVLYMQGKDIFSPYNKPDILDDRIKDQNVTLEDQILVFLSCCQHMPTLDQLVQNKCPVTDFLPVSFSCQKYLNIRSVNRKHKRKGENWGNYKNQWRAKRTEGYWTGWTI